MSNNTLVLGGTGKTGRRIAERLSALKVPVRIGSRSAQIPFDWYDPATWTDALDGISKVYISFQPDIAIPTAFGIIEKFVHAAKKAQVKQLVLLSGRGEKESMDCEGIIIQSGLDWTIVRSSWFMHNFSESFLLDSILQNKVVLPIIHAKEPFVDVEDIADVAVQALTNNIHSNKIYELTGPELLTFEYATSRIATVLNKKIQYMELPMDEYVSMLRSYQTPEDFIWLIKYLFSEVLDGRNESVTNDIEKVLGRRAGNFEDFVIRTSQTGVWGNVSEVQGVQEVQEVQKGIH